MKDNSYTIARAISQKKYYNSEAQVKKREEDKLDPSKIKARKEYNRRPYVMAKSKARSKLFRQSEEGQRYFKDYYSTPEAKSKQNQNYANPEVKKKRLKYQKRYDRKPENKIKKKAYKIKTRENYGKNN